MRYFNKIWAMALAGLLLLATAGLCFGADMTVSSGGPPPDGKQPPAPPNAAQLKEDLSRGLGRLVADKIITEKQKDSVVEYYGALFKKIAGQDPRKMRATCEQLKKDGKDPLSLLVKDGVLNKEQATAVDKLFSSKPPRPQNQPGCGPEGNQPPPSGDCQGGPCGCPPSSDANDLEKPFPCGNGFDWPGCCSDRDRGFREDDRMTPPPFNMVMMERVMDRLEVLVIAKIITRQQKGAILMFVHPFFAECRRGPWADPKPPQIWEKSEEAFQSGCPLEMKEAPARPDPQDRKDSKESRIPPKLQACLAQLVRDGVTNQEQMEIVAAALALPPLVGPCRPTPSNQEYRP